MKKVKIKIKLRINFQPLNYQQDDSAADFSADALAVQSLFFAVTWEGSVGVLVSIPTDCSSFHLGWAVIDFFSHSSCSRSSLLSSLCCGIYRSIQGRWDAV